MMDSSLLFTITGCHSTHSGVGFQKEMLSFKKANPQSNQKLSQSNHDSHYLPAKRAKASCEINGEIFPMTMSTFDKKLELKILRKSIKTRSTKARYCHFLSLDTSMPANTDSASSSLHNSKKRCYNSISTTSANIHKPHPLQSTPKVFDTTTGILCKDQANKSSAYHLTSLQKVLIVENASNDQKFLRRLFYEKGYDCEIIPNGHECLKMVSQTLLANRSFSYPAIILDQMMPGMNGLEIAKQLRNIGYNGIILGVTPLQCCQDMQEFLKAGATKVITKPFNISSLVNLIKNENYFN